MPKTSFRRNSGALEEDGRGESFTLTNGSWQSDADSHLTLTLNSSNSIFTLKHDDGNKQRFNNFGRIISQIDPVGRQTTYSYNSSGLLQTVTGPFGHALSFTYNPDNRLDTLTTPDLKVYRYEYDTLGNLVKVIYPDTSFRLYHYEDSSFPHALTGISDENGDRYATYGYDAANGKAIVTEHAVTSNGVAQEHFSLNYDSPTQTTVTDAVGTAEVFTFAGNLGVKNLLSKINQSDGKGLHKSYDANNNVVSVTDAENRVTTFEYNATNQLTAKNEAVGTIEERRTEYEYLSPELDLVTLIREPSVVAGQVKETVLVYNPDHTVQSITQNGFKPDGAPISRSSAFQYNSVGQVTLIDGPRTDVNDHTTLTYYECATGGACGQLATVTDAVGHTVTYDSYDANGRLTQMTDALGLVTTYSYDSRGRLLDVVETPPAGQGAARTTSYRYDAAGQVQTVTSAAGVVLSYSYDAAHDLRSVSDNLGNRIEYRYDAKGNRIQQDTRDPDGTLAQTVQTEYDLRNRLKTINAAGSITQLVRNAVGELISTTDANVNPPTTHRYDPLGRLEQTLDALGNPTDVQYDVQDRAVQVTAPNNASTQYSYDDLGNRLQESSPDRGVMLYQYNEAGDVIGLTDALGVTRSYHYDALNRLISVDFPGTEDDIAYIYDNCPQGNGRLCQSQNGSGSSVYHYDLFGNIVQVDRLVLGVTYSTGYQYDADDRLTAVTYPDGVRIDYVRNSLGQLTAATLTEAGNVTSLLSERRYRSDGRITYSGYGNGLIDQRDYDLQGRLTGYSLGGLLTRTYQYDANGNLIQDNRDGGSQGYTYDVLDRLGDEAGDLSLHHFDYDGNGNRLLKDSDTYTYQADSNRLATLAGTEVTLDAAGRLIRDASNHTYRYNPAGQLIGVDLAVRQKIHGQWLEVIEPLADYRYDVLGRRSSKTTTLSNSTTVYHYDLAGRLIAESDDAGSIRRRYVYADGQPLAYTDTVTVIDGKGKNQIVSEQTVLYYLHTDHLGTVDRATDMAGNLVWRWNKDAFGETGPDTDPDGDGTQVELNLRLPGQYFDSESGLYYNWHRYYDPQSGRYITSDPIGLEGGLNTFAYVRNNPVNWVDPFGLDDSGLNKICATNGQGTTCTSGMRAPPPGMPMNGPLCPIGVGGTTAELLSTAIPFLRIGKVAQSLSVTKGVKPAISPQKQAGHLPGTPQNANRLKQGKPTSSFFGEKSGERLTQQAFEKGKPVPGRPNVREHDFGISTGTGPNGGMQTRVRVHQGSKGRIHGHPSGPERY